MQSVSEILDLIYILDGIGLAIALILIVIFTYHKVASSTSKSYAVGSILAFIVGSSGYYSIYFIVTITWGNVIGLIGGYVLIILALIQYYFDKKKTPE